MPEAIRVLIADDHVIVRDGLRMILECEEDFQVAGEASDGAQAVKLVRDLEPDVVLMDVRMPGLDGLQALKQLRDKDPGVAVVVLTTYDDDEIVRESLKAGARGYLLKDTGRETLYRTIRAAARGETLLAPEVLDRCMSPDQPDSGKNASLTTRERQVLEAVTLGQRSREIAERFGITERTVKAHLANIYSKLGVQSRAGAIALAIKEKLVSSQ